MEEANEKIKPVFLNNGSILSWERPLKEGWYDPWKGMHDGQTTLIEHLGMDTLDETFGPFRLVGSAVKYLADINHLSTGQIRFETTQPFSNELKREILFSGQLAIYSSGKITGTELEGYDCMRVGKIWTAKTPSEIYSSPQGLKNLVFGESGDFDSMIGKRIESILEGYEVQDRKRAENQRAAQNSSWEEGMLTGQRDGPARHGGCC